jgi:hypothetical protein
MTPASRPRWPAFDSRAAQGWPQLEYGGAGLRPRCPTFPISRGGGKRKDGAPGVAVRPDDVCLLKVGQAVRLDRCPSLRGRVWPTSFGRLDAGWTEVGHGAWPQAPRPDRIPTGDLRRHLPGTRDTYIPIDIPGGATSLLRGEGGVRTSLWVSGPRVPSSLPTSIRGTQIPVLRHCTQRRATALRAARTRDARANRGTNESCPGSNSRWRNEP